MRFRATIAAIACLAVTCCVGPAPQPSRTPTTPRPTPTPTRAPAPTPVPTSTQWADQPQTPGDWRYSRVDGGSIARFGNGTPVFGLGCMANTRRVALLRYGVPATGAGSMIIRTEFFDRSVATQPSNDGRDQSAALEANDQLLDAMAFSKGRFAVEMAGAPVLYLPSWPEVTRVIEDCR